MNCSEITCALSLVFLLAYFVVVAFHTYSMRGSSASYASKNPSRYSRNLLFHSPLAGEIIAEEG
jgi:hypothetical protein